MILLLSQLPGDPQSGLRDQCQQDLSVDIQYCQGREGSSFFFSLEKIYDLLLLCGLFSFCADCLLTSYFSGEVYVLQYY